MTSLLGVQGNVGLAIRKNINIYICADLTYVLMWSLAIAIWGGYD